MTKGAESADLAALVRRLRIAIERRTMNAYVIIRLDDAETIIAALAALPASEQED